MSAAPADPAAPDSPDSPDSDPLRVMGIMRSDANADELVLQLSRPPDSGEIDAIFDAAQAAIVSQGGALSAEDRARAFIEWCALQAFGLRGWPAGAWVRLVALARGGTP